jgi:hypothetical protein
VFHLELASLIPKVAAKYTPYLRSIKSAAKVDGVRALPAILMGRRKLVRRAALEDWMMANETAAAEGAIGSLDVETAMSAPTNA